MLPRIDFDYCLNLRTPANYGDMPCWEPPNPKYPPPKPGEPRLHRAARLGDAAEIRAAIAAGDNLETEFDIALDPGARENLATALMVAAGSGEGATVETVKLLLELGADPKHLAGSHSAAEFACMGLGWNYKPGGDAERLGVLLEAGSPLPSDPEGSNKLLCAVAGSGDPARLNLLLQRGLNPRGYWSAEGAREKALRSAEHMAQIQTSQPDLFAGMPDDVRALLNETMRKNLADSVEQNASGPWSYEIPLFRAAESDNAECVRALLNAGADPLVRDNSRRTAVYFANSLPVLRILLAYGLALEDEDNYGWSPLMEAVRDGERAMDRINALLEAGADLNATTDRGYTIFMSAVGSLERHPQVMRRLIDAGADPHAVSELGYNAFHAAIDVNGEANAEESVRETLSYLKEIGVDIELRNNRGQTPMGRAIENGTGIEVQVLCELGADPNAVCPMHICGEAECNRPELPLLFHAVDGIGVQKDMKTESLLRAGANPDVKDGDGYSPIVRAVSALCADAPNYEKSFRTFFEGLKTLELDQRPMQKSRESFISEATMDVRRFVEQFASAIPVTESSEYSKKWRVERVNCIVSLCTFGAWSQRLSS